MKIQWNQIYTKKAKNQYYITNNKFALLPKIIPWSNDYDVNIWATTEWLYRSGKKEEIEICEEEVLNPIRDNWFRAEFEEGLFIHCCYPEDIIRFRRQYEMIYSNIREAEKDPTISIFKQIHNDCEFARSKLWAAWKCLGADGHKVSIKDKNNEVDMFEFEHPYSMWPRQWNKQCSRCCEPLPKALQMWIKLQHSKLKEAV